MSGDRECSFLSPPPKGSLHISMKRGKVTTAFVLMWNNRNPVSQEPLADLELRHSPQCLGLPLCVSLAGVECCGLGALPADLLCAQ